ncbi:olfactory receptor 4Q3-like [Thamnophis elegans]|uniref:olfactory receptor 4Q3-like n=1 Tax=Thamnophis elegans TaxID=35005 RepID=UPI001378916B|nr:olfactory receptor 4Q3-like [Thamnophis elegans]
MTRDDMLLFHTGSGKPVVVMAQAPPAHPDIIKDLLRMPRCPVIFMNVSEVTEFVFLGLSRSRPIQLLLSVLVIMCYTAILLGNLLIVLTVHIDPRLLKSPMYFFLANLSIIDTALGSVVVPKVATDLITCGRTISFGGCMSQLFFLHFLGCSEMFLLTLMAYDRYVAICHPLTYTIKMNRPHCVRLLCFCWAGGLLHSGSQLFLVLQLPFCGPNKLDNFFCDVPQIVKLACVDTQVTEILMVANSGLISLFCFVILLISYGIILSTLQGRFKESGGKALYTCSSHLMVVSLFFLPCLFVYLVPIFSSTLDKVASVFYTTITPFLNAMIYTLRNQEMKEAMGRVTKKNMLARCFQKEGKI